MGVRMKGLKEFIIAILSVISALIDNIKIGDILAIICVCGLIFISHEAIKTIKR